jgi:hypothetical protein
MNRYILLPNSKDKSLAKRLKNYFLIPIVYLVRAGGPAHGPSHPAQEPVADFQAPGLCDSMAV